MTPIGVLDDAAYHLWAAAYHLWERASLKDLHEFSHTFPDLHEVFLDRWRRDGVDYEEDVT